MFSLKVITLWFAACCCGVCGESGIKNVLGPLSDREITTNEIIIDKPHSNKSKLGLNSSQIESINLTSDSSSRHCACEDGGYSKNLCLTEGCVRAAATILTSIDRSADPCEDFYQYACGGFIERVGSISIDDSLDSGGSGIGEGSDSSGADRFSAIDRRNQNMVAKVLAHPVPRNQTDLGAEDKARLYFQTCVAAGGDAAATVASDKRELVSLQAVVDFAGGWSLSGTGANASVGFERRVQLAQNSLGLEALFQWGVVPINGTHRPAVIAGGWEEEMLANGGSHTKQKQTESAGGNTDDGGSGGGSSDYLKLMSMYVLLLAQTTEEELVEMELEDYVIEPEAHVEDTVHANGSNDADGGIQIAEYDDLINYVDYDYNDTSHKADSNATDDLDLDRLWYVLNPFNWISSNESSANGPTRSNSSTPVAEIEITVETAVRPDDDEELTIETVKKGDFQADEFAEKQSHGIPSSPPPYEDNIGLILQRNRVIESAMSAVLAFEKALAKISSRPKDVNGLKPFTVTEMSDKFGFLNWTEFFDGAFAQLAGKNLGDMGGKDMIVMVQEDFLSGVTSLVKEYQSTADGEAVLTNYLMWRVLCAFFPDHSTDCAQHRENCLKDTEVMFAPAVTAMYVRAKGVDKAHEVVRQVDKMVTAMKAAFKKNLPHLSWMSPESLKAAEAKLEKIADYIGFPAFILNSTWLDALYTDVQVSEEDHLLNMVTNKAFAKRVEVATLFQGSRKQHNGSWRDDLAHVSGVASVNAYYNQASNAVVVPISALQPPLFWNRPKALTFGAFGIVVGHEITHAFDDMGILYNAAGAFRPLYDSATLAAFHTASDCVRKQYNQYSIGGGVTVDGSLTLGENIADLGGLRISEVAYDEWLASADGGVDDVLPALGEELSHKRLFYLGYALPWCAAHSERMVRAHAAKDEHAPDRFRVIGPLSNSPGFAEAWGCPLGSPMNPVNKCSVW